MDVWVADPARDAPHVAALRTAWTATPGEESTAWGYVGHVFVFRWRAGRGSATR
ncbi:hypothetical protein [Tsukamurella sp. NPDC003166]|uniref:hypothetical protein n=1 Tax=Tsukamurella sp. NPDC003166 TaxID=3154444 RepID=UPI0033A14E10